LTVPPRSTDLDQDPLPYQLALKDRALASAAEGITISDLRLPDNPLVYVNRGFTELTGYRREESIGRNCRYLQGPDTRPEKVAEIREAIAARRPCVVELLNYRADGSSFWNRLSLTPLRDADGEVTHYIGVQSDVTREREAEDAVRDANRRLEDINRRMQRDLDAAAAIQRSLLPQQAPSREGIRLAWHLDPCDELAGDTLNILPLDDDRLASYVLDVSGHGVPAALLSVTLHRWLSPDPDRSVLRTPGAAPEAPPRILSPDLVARQLNVQFPMDMANTQYFTLVYGILDQRRREFHYVTAGHQPPVHVPVAREPHQLEAAGTAIGFFPDSEYQTRRVSLSPGDRLYLFSDGLPESADPDGEQFEMARVMAGVDAYRAQELDESVASLVAEARQWRGDRPPDDDLTVLAIEVS